MAFLDNSGDIILDAVLTDAGRARLARGDGSFKIVKYAFADDEIDYEKYDLNHESGSAYFDINILTTPVIEALTNNTSTMKNRLLSIPKTNLLYLPKLELNQAGNGLDGTKLNQETNTANSFIISVDGDTDKIFSGNDRKVDSDYSLDNNGIFLSNTAVGDGGLSTQNSFIGVDQGLDTSNIPPTYTIDPTLRETQYIVEIDNRLGSIANKDGDLQQYSFLDDDNIASYSFGSGNSSLFDDLSPTSNSPIRGPRGSKLSLRIAPSIELNSSTYLFTLLGTTQSLTFSTHSTKSYYRIDSTVRITGATTGYRLDIPLVFIKKNH
tara:strand:+ start:366 stop:1334 length:969 start_codon:yes stop_codon:yes gene_type:complete